MRFQFVIALVAFGAASIRLHAADIAFGPAQHAISQATDFTFTGTLDRAYAFGAASNLDVGGITFTPFASNSVGDSTNLDGPTSFSGSGLAGNYATLLSHGLSRDGSPAVIQLNNLVPGAVYTANVIGMGLRARTDCCSAGAGYTNGFISGDSPLGGQPVHWDGGDSTSQNLRGTFVADPAGRQNINFNLYGTSAFDPLTISANINALVLSYTSVPEPASLGLLALVVVAATLRTRTGIGRS